MKETKKLIKKCPFSATGKHDFSNWEIIERGWIDNNEDDTTQWIEKYYKKCDRCGFVDDRKIIDNSKPIQKQSHKMADFSME